MSEDYFAKKWSEGDIVFLSVIGFGILVLFAGFLYCFLRIICTSNCCETVSQTPIRKQMPRQKKDNFFKGVK
eukprot:04190.XXX_159770_158011_1 [CDS] Oithona nana genome sequencing.